VSANDAAYALAVRASGSPEAFSGAMDAAARRLGMRDSTFRDPAGLDGPEGVGGGSAVSAFDLAVLARNVLEVPAIAGTARMREYHFTGPDGVTHFLDNHNRRFLDGYPGAFGLKTGYTSRALGTLVTAARRDGRTLIAVVLGAGDTVGWSAALLDYGFATPVPPGETGAVLPPVRVDASGRFLRTGAAGPAHRPAVDGAERRTAAITPAAAAGDAVSWSGVALAAAGLALAGGVALLGAGRLTRRRRLRRPG